MQRFSTLLLAVLLLLVACCAWSADSRGASAQDQDFQFEFEQEFDQDFGQSEELTPAQMMIVLIVGGAILVLGLGIAIFVCYLLYGLLQALPAEHRSMEPGMVWLLLIPCFNLVWNFFVFQRISASYQSYFNSIGRGDVGDCGRMLGLWYAICIVLASIPCLNYVTGPICGPASLVLLIIYLVKLHGLKGQIQAKPGLSGAY